MRAALKTFEVQLNGAVSVSTLSISTASLAFGSVVVNTAATPQPVTLTSTGTAPVTVSGAVVTGAGFAISGGTFPVTLNAGQAATLSIVFDPATVGAATGQLTITSNSSTSGRAVVIVSGTGTAAPASPAALSALSCVSGTMTGSGTDACTVTLTAAAPANGLTVNLSSAVRGDGTGHGDRARERDQHRIHGERGFGGGRSGGDDNGERRRRFQSFWAAAECCGADTEHQHGQPGVRQCGGEHGGRASVCNPYFDRCCAGNRQLGSRDGGGFRDFGGHIPGDIECGPGGDIQYSVRSHGRGCGYGSTDHQ